MTDFDPEAYLQTQTGNAPPAFDPEAYLQHVTPDPPAPKKYVSPLDDPAARAGQGGLTDIVDTAVGGAVQGTVNSIVGGYKGIVSLLRGKGMDDAANEVDQFAAQNAPPTPTTAAGQNTAAVMNSPYNPVNYPVVAGKKLGQASEAIGLPPSVSAAAEALPVAVTSILGMRTGASEESAPAVSKPTAAPTAPSAAPPLTLAPGPGRPAPTPPAAAPAPAALSASGSPRAGYWEPPASPAEAPKFPESAPAAPSGTKLPDAEQAQRQAILQRVGVPETRQSALEGDAQTASNDYQESKLTSPNGVRMKAVIDGERTALENHANSIVQDTGGTPGTAVDEATKLERGQNILAPLDDLKKHFDDATKSLYQQADQRAQGKQISYPTVQSIISGRGSEFLGTVEGKQLLQGVKARMSDLGMLDEDGNAQPASVQAGERFRQYLNDNWTPRTSKLIGRLKDGTDDDVTQSAGEDIYGAARAMRAQRARTLDDPNGIAKLMDSSGPQGVNRAVPVEKVADTVTTMPVAQLQHVVKTLQNVPDELQPQAQTALNEIKAHMAAKVADAGKSTSSMWNAKGVTQTLTKNSARMQGLFTPDEMAKFGDLNDAGNILKKDQSYPGAAVQEHNLVRAGAMGVMRSGAAAAGAYLGGPLGAGVGDALASKAIGKLDARAAMQNVERRIRQIPPP
jgi:hypothetical protein